MSYTIYVPSYSTVNWTGDPPEGKRKFSQPAVKYFDAGADCQHTRTGDAEYQAISAVCQNRACDTQGSNLVNGTPLAQKDTCPHCETNYTGIQTDSDAFHTLLRSCNYDHGGECTWGSGTADTTDGGAEHACIGMSKYGLKEPFKMGDNAGGHQPDGPAGSTCPRILTSEHNAGNPDYFMAHEWRDPNLLNQGHLTVPRDPQLVYYVGAHDDALGKHWSTIFRTTNPKDHRQSKNGIEITKYGAYRELCTSDRGEGRTDSFPCIEAPPSGGGTWSSSTIWGHYIKPTVERKMPIWCSYTLDHHKHPVNINNQVDLAYLYDFFNTINGVQGERNKTEGIRKELDYAATHGSEQKGRASQYIRKKIGDYCLSPWNEEAETVALEAAVDGWLGATGEIHDNFGTRWNTEALRAYKQAVQDAGKDNACDLPAPGGTEAWSPVAIKHCTDKKTQVTCEPEDGVPSLCEWKEPGELCAAAALDGAREESCNAHPSDKCKWEGSACVPKEASPPTGYCIPKSACTPLTTRSSGVAAVPANEMCKVWWESLKLQLPERTRISIETRSGPALQCDGTGTDKESYQTCRKVTVDEMAEISKCTGVHGCKIKDLHVDTDGKCVGIESENDNVCAGESKSTCFGIKQETDYICKWGPRQTLDDYLHKVNNDIKSVCRPDSRSHAVGWSSACQCQNIEPTAGESYSADFASDDLYKSIDQAIEFFQGLGASTGEGGGGAACGITAHDLSGPVPYQQFAKCVGYPQCMQGSGGQIENLLPLDLYTTLCDQMACSNACITVTSGGSMSAGGNIYQDVHQHCIGETVTVRDSGDSGQSAKSCPATEPYNNSCGTGKQYISGGGAIYTGEEGGGNNPGDDYQSKCCRSTSSDSWWSDLTDIFGGVRRGPAASVTPGFFNNPLIWLAGTAVIVGLLACWYYYSRKALSTSQVSDGSVQAAKPAVLK